MCFIWFLNYLLLAPPQPTSFLGRFLFSLFVCVQNNFVGKVGSHCLATGGTRSKPPVPVVLWEERSRRAVTQSLEREPTVLCLGTSGSLDSKIHTTKSLVEVLCSLCVQ